ncbi:uncharacterized protein F5891DRAFT_159056 [Suillus fuscotomentosus]|uniref:Uncharacterized protein n=1 Tax=Suillus fuscotomentosus TaxID=1912939 RepID=A0AAD4E9V0_9AGAM|nr:uncharacterized protein F5891DRAFT_159056 [Suillus fuscotomentosus]KAG1902319.1 hypothetical protein F5891DRAFT_159056 [Suillus fuscotomentosus]
MRFSFLTVIVALTTSMMSVSACGLFGDKCTEDNDCCTTKPKLLYCVNDVSRSSLLCITSLDDSSFGPRNIRYAIVLAEEAGEFARSNILVGCVSIFLLMLFSME